MRLIFLSFLAVGCMSSSQPVSSNPIFNQKNDFELCDSVFSALPSRLTTIYKQSEVEKTVVLVWHTMGIIENGGFSYLLSHNISGDPGFGETVAAYERINCNFVSKSFLKASELFETPNEQKIYFETFTNLPFPVFSKDRESTIEKNKSFFEPLDNAFYSKSKLIESSLANYIKKHQLTLEKLFNETTK